MTDPQIAAESMALFHIFASVVDMSRVEIRTLKLTLQGVRTLPAVKPRLTPACIALSKSTDSQNLLTFLNY